MRVLALMFAAFLVAAPATAARGAPHGAPPIVAATPCDLGVVLLRQVAATDRARGVIYDQAPFRPAPIAASARGMSPPPGVPADLAARWNSSGRSNLLSACPTVAAALPVGVRLATDADRAAVAGAAHGPTLHFISTPVTSTDGKRVLIEVASRCAGLCGAGFVRHFRKTARGWVELPYAGLWLS